MGTMEYRVYVPDRLNSGKRVPSEFFANLEIRLVSIAGGFSRSHAIGGYTMSDGTLKREPVYVYTLLAPDTGAIQERIRSLAFHVKGMLAQESVLVVSRPVDSELV